MIIASKVEVAVAYLWFLDNFYIYKLLILGSDRKRSESLLGELPLGKIIIDFS